MRPHCAGADLAVRDTRDKEEDVVGNAVITLSLYVKSPFLFGLERKQTGLLQKQICGRSFLPLCCASSALMRANSRVESKQQ